MTHKMKNLHILPTDKPSRLFKDDFGKLIYSINMDQEQNHFEPQHLFITSDEEIKFNEYVIQVNFEKTNTQVIRCTTEFQVKIANDEDGSFTKKKIILTTDQDLIKDGVQAIDDKFLEWFVKNPSCENVKVELIEEIPSGFTFGMFGNDEPPTELVYKKKHLKRLLKDYILYLKEVQYGIHQKMIVLKQINKKDLLKVLNGKQKECIVRRI